MDDIKKDPFEEYIRQTEPSRRELGYAWYTAIGLQAVDGLETSDYLKETARKNIEGKITLPEAGKLIESYYKESSEKTHVRWKKQDIEIPGAFSNKTKQHIQILYAEFGNEQFFGRTEVMNMLGITASPA